MRDCQDSLRAEYVAVTDKEALEGFKALCRTEGIIPALEPSHALYYAMQLAKTMPKEAVILVNLCGRGDKDMHTVAHAMGVTLRDNMADKVRARARLRAWRQELLVSQRATRAVVQLDESGVPVRLVRAREC